MPTYLYKVVKFWEATSEGWLYGSVLHRLLPNASGQELLPGLVCEWLNGLTDSWRFLRSTLQNKNSVWPHLNCMDGSILAFLNCTDGSVLAFLNCTDGSVLTHLNGSYGSSGFPLNLVSLDCHSRGFLWYHGYYVRKATKNRVWNRMTFLTSKTYTTLNYILCTIDTVPTLSSPHNPDCQRSTGQRPVSTRAVLHRRGHTEHTVHQPNLSGGHWTCAQAWRD